MQWRSAGARAAAVLLAVAAAGAGSAPAAGAAQPATERLTPHQYTAEHRDGCLADRTEGGMVWATADRVHVTGVLEEQRRTRDCAQRTFAEFVAYAHNGRLPVDRHHEYLDPATGDPHQYRFALENNGPNAGDVIDRVEVRVCVTTGPTLPAYTCGATVTVPRNSIGPRPAEPAV